MRTYSAKLVNTTKASADHPIPDVNVAGQRCVVGQNGLIADYTVMRDMTIGHDPVVVTECCFAGILRRASANRAKLSNRVPVAYDKARRFARVLLVLGVVPDGRELIDVIVFANCRRTMDDHVTIDFRAAADFNSIADHRVRTNLDVIRDFRCIRNYGC